MAGDVLLLFRMVEALVGLQIAIVSFKIYHDDHPAAWQYLGYSGMVLALWAVLSLYTQIGGSPFAYIVEGGGVPIFSVLLSASVLVFITRSFPLDLPKHISFGNGILYLGSIVVFFGFSGLLLYPVSPESFFTFFYSSTLLLIIPAIYGFYKIPEALQTQTWRYFALTSGLIYLSVLLNLYATAFCGIGGSKVGSAICVNYAYSFGSIYSLPLFEPLLLISTSAPAIMLAAIIFFGYGATLLYHHMYQGAQQSSTSGTPVEQLVENTVSNIGNIIGKPLARRIAANALREDGPDNVTAAFNDDTLTVTVEDEDENTFDAVKETLIHRFEGTIGPVAGRTIRDVADNIGRDSDG